MMIFCDGFSHYTNAFMPDMWDVVSVPYGVNPSAPSDTVSITQGLTSGRFGEGGVVFASPTLANLNSTAQRNDGQYIQQNYTGVSVIIAGLAIQQNGTQLTAGSRLITFLDSATTQVGIDIMPSGQLRAVRSTSAGTGIYLCAIGSIGSPPTYTELGTSAASISSNAFDFLEFKITHHSSAGIIEIKRNGEVFWTLSGVNTAVSGTNQSASMLVGGYGAVFTSNLGTLQAHYLRGTVSDVYLLNTTANGSDALDPVDFIGDRHWQVRTPTTDGHYTAWTCSTGSNHAALVDEIPPNTTDFNSTSTVGNIDSFNTDAPTGPATASCIVAYTMYLQKDTGGATGVQGLFRLSGSDRVGTEFQVPNPWAYQQSFLCSKPGGGAITVADFDAGEHGYKLSS